jgi:hypothetical protein
MRTMKNTHYPNDNSGLCFDRIIEINKLKNDAALARFLEIKPPVISKTRHGNLPFGPLMILNVHDKTGLSIAEIRRLIASKK